MCIYIFIMVCVNVYIFSYLSAYICININDIHKFYEMGFGVNICDRTKVIKNLFFYLG